MFIKNDEICKQMSFLNYILLIYTTVLTPIFSIT